MTTLHDHYPLTSDQIKQYANDGYIKLKQVLSPDLLKKYSDEITREVYQRNPLFGIPMSERTTYQKAFIQITNLWLQNEVVKEFVFSKRLARIAAELMQVNGVRLYHDQALFKEADGKFTPWHADQYYWPLDNNNTTTVWIPLQETPVEMGPLAFSVASHHTPIGRDLAISDESEAFIQQALKDSNFDYAESAYELGEVSFHSGWTFHRAGANTTTHNRGVMTIIYMEDGIRVSPFLNKEHPVDRDAFIPNREPGELANTNLNPIMWSKS
jgi:ectoine hydroxylase-related dioxygenase (phytanoyl-CoA dioxygenase family)